MRGGRDSDQPRGQDRDNEHGTKSTDRWHNAPHVWLREPPHPPVPTSSTDGLTHVLYRGSSLWHHGRTVTELPPGRGDGQADYHSPGEDGRPTGLES